VPQKKQKGEKRREQKKKKRNRLTNETVLFGGVKGNCRKEVMKGGVLAGGAAQEDWLKMQ